MARLIVNIDVDDLKRAIAFYEVGLGFRFLRHLFDGSVAEMALGPTKIYLLEMAAGTPAAAGARRDYGRHWTPVHFDIVVDDLDAAIERAIAAGAAPEGAIGRYDWGNLAGFADPFGHGFCLVQFAGAGYDSVEA